MNSLLLMIKEELILSMKYSNNMLIQKYNHFQVVYWTFNFNIYLANQGYDVWEISNPSI